MRIPNRATGGAIVTLEFSDNAEYPPGRGLSYFDRPALRAASMRSYVILAFDVAKRGQRDFNARRG